MMQILAFSGVSSKKSCGNPGAARGESNEELDGVDVRDGIAAGPAGVGLITIAMFRNFYAVPRTSKMTRSHRLCRASRRLWLCAEVLERVKCSRARSRSPGRCPIDSFAGVGFALNPVATLVGSNNGQPDNSVGDYQVQVNWGDGHGFSFDGVELVSLGGGALLGEGHAHLPDGEQLVCGGPSK